MLMSSQASRYAHALLDARAESRTIPLLSSNDALSVPDAYQISARIATIRTAQGETQVGRKIGFTIRKEWDRYGITDGVGAPIWAPVFDTTVRYADNNQGAQSLDGALQPRIEPEIIFKLGSTPPPDATLEQMADCIEWMAHGFEIVSCPFPSWEFTAADAIAAFGLHGALIVGEPHVLSSTTRRNLAVLLSSASVSLSCSTDENAILRAAGFCNDLLDSPLHALLQLHRLLKTQPDEPPLRAGEIVSTGTWTDAYPIQAGQTWITAFSGIALQGLTVKFV
jgi:2-keto-4-pentenoate hydratase